MELNPYENSVNPILNEPKNLETHNDPVLNQMYTMFNQKVSKNVNNSNNNFQMLDYKLSNIKEERGEVTYRSLIMSLFFNGSDYGVLWRNKFVGLFQSLFLTIRGGINTNTEISQLKYFEFLTALPLTVYKKPPDGEPPDGEPLDGQPSDTDNILMWMLRYNIRSVGEIDVSNINEVLGSIFHDPDYGPELIRTLFSQIYSFCSPTNSQESTSLLQNHVLLPIVTFLSKPTQHISSDSQQSLTVDSQTIFGLQVNGIRNIVPDIIIKLEGKPILIGEMKRVPIFGTH